MSGPGASTSSHNTTPSSHGTGKPGANHSAQGPGTAHPAHDAAHEHGTAEQAEHYAHLAHSIHLAAEAAEAIAHVVHKGTEFVHHAEAARKQLKTVSQMFYDVRKMARTIAKLENVARQGGNVGAKGAAALARAKEAYAAATAELSLERTTLKAANEVVQEYKAAQSTLRGWGAVRAAQAVSKLEVVLEGSRVGRGLMTTGRIVASKGFNRALIVVGAAAEGVASYADSTAQTQTGKAANAALGAGLGALTMANPYVAAGDAIAPKGYKLSELYHGTAGVVSAFGETLASHERNKQGVLIFDTKPIDDFHSRSMQGHYGKVLQAASEAGEFWANKGITGGLHEFVESVHWWVNH